mmetsp:Transcript_7815/g.9410  ORF Transcript_7815/g.9410 Transcript_7815/m.9410 type:complete len:96 (+) Transcript_7815:80-367(+)
MCRVSWVILNITRINIVQVLAFTNNQVKSATFTTAEAALPQGQLQNQIRRRNQKHSCLQANFLELKHLKILFCQVQAPGLLSLRCYRLILDLEIP